MKTAETVFVVPTYRLRDVAETIEAYDEHFWSNGHSVKMDLETNVSTQFTTENSLLLQERPVSKRAVIKIAQTVRTGTNDIDTLDYVFMYLNDEKQSQSELHHVNDVYVLDNFRPVVTNKNWRIDCGVAGYDNRLGLPPFFPTRLRFEDYIYRLWIHQDGIVSAHTDAVQTHIKSNDLRNPPAVGSFQRRNLHIVKEEDQRQPRVGR